MANNSQRTSKRFCSSIEKECSLCCKIKPHSEFHKDKGNIRAYGLTYYCKECASMKGRLYHNKHKNNAEYKLKRRASGKMTDYGITLEEYTEKLLSQGSICSICYIKLPLEGHLTHLDHCHTTGSLRDFLCTNCNRGLGHFKDSQMLLQSAINYLQKHSGACSLPQKAATCP